MVAAQSFQRVAVVVPGGGYGPQGPLLMYAGEVALARGAEVYPLSWTEDPFGMAYSERGPWAARQARTVLDRVSAESPGSVPLLIGKSLGSHAAVLAAEDQLPAIWITPLLTDESVVAALRRAQAPLLLVGGTADKLWDGAVAREVSPHVLEVDGADHGMYVPGPLAASAEVLGQVATVMEEFLDDVAWRSPPQ